MSSYTGLYVQRLSSGEIHSVQVVDTGGKSLPLDPAIYISRQIKPPIEELPDFDGYQAAAAAAAAAAPGPAESGVSPVILALAAWVRGEEVSVEAIYRMRQFGFVYPDAIESLRLTPSGEQVLRDNRLI